VDHNVLLANLLAVLDDMKVRPALFCGHDEPAAAATYLAGFSAAAGVALGWNWERRFDVRDEVKTNRGWRLASGGPKQEMIAKGWSDSQIVLEYIEIEAEFIRRMAETRVTTE
jgi:hypothetical protein